LEVGSHLKLGSIVHGDCECHANWPGFLLDINCNQITPQIHTGTTSPMSTFDILQRILLYSGFRY
jgi:hypothetical protein